MKSTTSETEIAAERSAIWEILTDLKDISSWVPTFKFISISGPSSIGRGTQFGSVRFHVN